MTGLLHEVIVIGGGPAGIACALWLHQFQVPVLLLEAGERLGGSQWLYDYPEHWIPGMQGRTGRQNAAGMERHAIDAGVPHRLRSTVRNVRRSDISGAFEIEVASTVTGGLLQARHLVIATGTRARRGGFTESDNVGIGPGVAMDRILVQDRRVAVLGGGDNAFDQARLLRERGACQVRVYSRSVPRAQPALRQKIDPTDVEIGEFEADAQRMTVNGLPYDVFGVMYGVEPCLPASIEFPLPLRDGYIEVDRCGAVASVPDFYAAGEITRYWHPCVATAIGHGAQVARAIHDRLNARPPRT